MSDSCCEKWETALRQRRLCGWLKKQSHEKIQFLRKWQWRFFVLDYTAKTLSYYLDEDLHDERGEYLLDGAILSEVRNYGRRHRQHQLMVSGLKGDRADVLYIYGQSLEEINLWFAALRFVVKGEHKDILEMRLWMDSVKIAAEALKLRLEFDKSAVHSGRQLSTSSMSACLIEVESFSTSSGAHSVELERQWDKQNQCRLLITFCQNQFSQLRERINKKPYSNTDFELSFAQSTRMDECLLFLEDISSSQLLDKSCRLNDFWFQILDMTISVLSSIPGPMLQVYVRDMRFTVYGLLNGILGDSSEMRLIYDLTNAEHIRK